MRRKIFRNRCPECYQKEELCLCAEIPRLDLSIRVVFITHRSELLSTTNTGRIASQALVNSEVRWRGVYGMDLDCSDLDAADSALLFPGPYATELCPGALPKPKTLVVPDGTWTQASRCVRRERVLLRMKRVTVPVENPSPFRMRSGPGPAFLSTIEAVARALGAWEGLAVRTQLDGLYDRMASRTLESRGRIRMPEQVG